MVGESGAARGVVVGGAAGLEVEVVPGRGRDDPVHPRDQIANAGADTDVGMLSGAAGVPGEPRAARDSAFL